MLIDARGGVRYANAAAKRLLDARDGIFLERGRLTATTSAGRAGLQRLLGMVLGRSGFARGGVAVERPGARPLIVRALPVSGSFRAPIPRTAAIVLVQDPSHPREIDPDVLAMLGLTHAESRLAGALASGGNLADYASGAGLSMHTVRSTLRDVLAKTDTHRQSELVAMLSRLAKP
jgi:DNA-binding CsgD family transcriptional regulator